MISALRPILLSRPVRVSVLAAVAAAVMIGAVVAPRAAARPQGPDADSRQIALAVRIYLERQHISKQRIDDVISERCLEAYLKSLDPGKLYFYQSDVDEFLQKRFALDDMIRRGDISFAYTVFSRFLARVDERVETAIALVDAPHDFTIDEEMVNDRDAVTYPKTPEEAAERWRKRVKFSLLVEKADGDEDEEAAPGDKDEEARAKLRKRYSGIRKRWQQTNDDDLLELYLTSMTSGFDPHSSYLSPSTLEDFEINFRLELDGIGASLRSEDGYTEVHEVIAGGAADMDGRLKKGDQIVGVGQGTAGPVEDIVDRRLRDVVKLIRGKRGTVVRLEVRPVDNPKTTEIYEITRAQIKLTNQAARSVIVPWGEKANGEPYRLGVIHLPSFYLDMKGAQEGRPDAKSCRRDVERLLREFNQEGVDAVVVDLRFNGGGSLQEAVGLTGLFLDQGPVVQVKGPDGRTIPYDDPAPGMVWSGPVAVLTSMFSASASEIFAGAIQDYGRGVVIGDRSTHGKGTVQMLINLDDRLFRPGSGHKYGALKLTIQQFYRPGGDSTQNRGVLADVEIPALTGHLEGIAEADLDYPLEFSRVRQLEHDRFGMMGPAIKAQLQTASAGRIDRSEEFRKDNRRIELYEEQKDRKAVTLNLEKYLAEREELDTEKELEKTAEQQTDSDRPVFDVEDHYNQEAMAIVVDYLRLLREKKVAVTR